MSEESFDLSDEDDVRKAKAKAKVAILEERNDMRAIMSMPEGQRVMWRILSRTGVYRSSFTGNSKTFFLEGQRNIGLWLLDILHRDALEQFQEMELQARAEFKAKDDER